MVSKKIMKRIFKEVIKAHKSLKKDNVFSTYYTELFVIKHIEYFLYSGYFDFESFFVNPYKIAVQYNTHPLTEKGLAEYYRLFKFKKFLSKLIDNYI